MSTESTYNTHAPSLLERVRALDRSEELSAQYIPLILFHPHTPNLVDNSSPYVAIGHVETSFIESTLIHCQNEDGDAIFVKEQFLPNRHGITTEVLRLCEDYRQSHETVESRYDYKELFQKRTAAFEHVTNHLICAGFIPRKHSDVYPIQPFVQPPSNRRTSKDDKGTVLAHVNRNTAPYIGIDSVGVHLHCYVRQTEGTTVNGVWLAKRAPNKSHHPNYWDPTVAGGQPANLSILENIVKEGHEEAGVPSKWIQCDGTSIDASATVFTDHTNDPLTITTAKPDGPSCMKRSLYYSCDLQVPPNWKPTAVDGEVSEFKLYSVDELEDELRYGNSVRPAMRAVLVDFMIRHGVLKEEEQILAELGDAMRRGRLMLW